MPDDLDSLPEKLGAALRQRRWRIACAESCTGGGVAAAITSVPGSSDWFEYGFVTYADAAKVKVLGVSEATLGRFGAVSGEVVGEMAAGALAASGADLAVAVSGVAGPGGGSEEKPVGTVWFAWASRETSHVRAYRFDGDRARIRKLAVVTALAGVIDFIDNAV
jgi:nicotinamide-nucleotide amidase